MNLSLETYEEKKILEIKENGEEVYSGIPSDEELFSKLITLLKFPENDKSIDFPTFFTPPNHLKIFKSTEKIKSNGDLIQILNLIYEIKKSTYLGVSDINQSLNFSNLSQRIFKEKKNNIDYSINILNIGLENLKKRIKKNNEKFKELKERKMKWKLQRIQNQSIIDISFSKSIMTINKKIPIYLVIKKDGSFEYKIPSICTFYKQITMGTKLLNEFKSIDNVVKKSQNSIFNQELFDFISLKLKDRIIYHKKNEIKLKLNFDDILTFSLKNDNIFISFHSSFENEFTNILLKDILLKIFENKKEDFKILNAFEFLKHKKFCLLIMNKLNEENLKFKFESFQYPNLSILKINNKILQIGKGELFLTSNKMLIKIHLKELIFMLKK
eukprot:gene2450-3160_t